MIVWVVSLKSMDDDVVGVAYNNDLAEPAVMQTGHLNFLARQKDYRINEQWAPSEKYIF